MGKAVDTIKSVARATGGVQGMIAGGSFMPGVLSGADPTTRDQAGQQEVNASIENVKSQQTAAQHQLELQQQQVAKAQGTTDTSLNLLQTAAQGGAPSQAQGILQQGLDQGIAAQMAAANSGNMSNQIVRQRAAADQGANLTQQTANQAGMLRAGEMATARGQFNQGATQNLGLGIGAQQSTQSNMAQLAATQGNIATSQMQTDQNRLNESGKARSGLIGGLINGVGGSIGLADGGKVPGKEVVKGDSEKNDIVPTLLSAGEIVIPKSATKDLKTAISFLEKIMHEKGESEETEDSKESAKKLFEKKKG